MFADAVPCKGAVEKGLAVDSLVGDVKWIGCAAMILKCYNEPVIVKLLAEALSGVESTRGRANAGRAFARVRLAG